MEPELIERIEGRAGRLSLNRPAALNALSHQQCLDTEAALNRWADDSTVDLVILDGIGPRAFCSGGDIAYCALAGQKGDYAPGRAFWRDEYRMNLRLSRYEKPIVSFMHGFVMGGGVGYGGHVGTRIVGESTQVAMPECGIGLIPDVGGTYLLAKAPGHLGLYLALTAARMGPADAIYAGFADHFVPEAEWEALKAMLAETGRVEIAGQTPPPGRFEALQPVIDRHFGHASIPEIIASLEGDDSDFATETLKALRRNAPLSMASSLAMIRPGPASLEAALQQEFRWTWRSMDKGDFLEGVRAQILDKDRNPKWQHARPADVSAADVAAMLAPLGENEWIPAPQGA